MVDGLRIMLWGFVKKLIVADRLATYVDAVYNNAEHHSGVTMIVATCFLRSRYIAIFGLFRHRHWCGQSNGLRSYDQFQAADPCFKKVYRKCGSDGISH